MTMGRDGHFVLVVLVGVYVEYWVRIEWMVSFSVLICSSESNC